MTFNKIRRVIENYAGSKLHTKGWIQEAALRMLFNNLNPDVAERPEDLVVYGGIGKAARNWECFDAIVETLKILKTMKRCSFSQVNRLPCSKHTLMPQEF